MRGARHAATRRRHAVDAASPSRRRMPRPSQRARSIPLYIHFILLGPPPPSTLQVGYYQPLSQWSKGEYADAKTTQDDLAIIASKVGYRADDHGDSAATATALAGPGAPTTGNIERTGDVDWFTFNAAAGTASLTLALAPAYGGQARSNVDVRVQVFPACSYVPLATWDPSTGLFAGTQSTTLPAQGTYYVTVQGVGQVGGGAGGRAAVCEWAGVVVCVGACERASRGAPYRLPGLGQPPPFCVPHPSSIHPCLLTHQPSPSTACHPLAGR